MYQFIIFQAKSVEVISFLYAPEVMTKLVEKASELELRRIVGIFRKEGEKNEFRVFLFLI